MACGRWRRNQDARAAYGRWNRTQDSQEAATTSLASGRRDGASDACVVFADAIGTHHSASHLSSSFSVSRAFSYCTSDYHTSATSAYRSPTYISKRKRMHLMRAQCVLCVLCILSSVPASVRVPCVVSPSPPPTCHYCVLSCAATLPCIRT